MSDFSKYDTEKSWLIYDEKYKDCDVAMMNAYRSQLYTMAEISDYFDVSYPMVSRLISNAAKSKI